MTRARGLGGADAPPSARVGRLGPAYDLMAAYDPDSGFLMERGGLGVAGRGAAARVVVGPGLDQAARADLAVHEALRAVDAPPEAPPPVAVGAFPFGGSAEAVMVIPRRAVRRTASGETWEITLGGPGGQGVEADRRWVGRTAPHEAFAEIQLRPEPTGEAYEGAVAEVVRRIRSGRLRKVVLARSVVVEAGRELDPRQLLWRLRAVDPGCFAFAVPTARGVLVGASPELLVARHGREVRADPLAGSAPRSGDPRDDRAAGASLLASAKDREEHALVAEAVADALGPFCEGLEFDRDPVLLGTANVWHLCTRFRGRLREPPATALELAAVLHPTPAVCGTPREAARSAIAELEPFDRGWYAGPVGWVDAAGNGEWAIALRCAELSGETARLFAGAGIVADSVPERELDETERKFRAFLDSLRWG